MENKNETGKSEKLNELLREKTVSYILAAFGLVAGLAWNEAIKSLIEYVFPAAGNSIIAKVFYALVLTIILVVVSAHLTRHSETENKE